MRAWFALAVMMVVVAACDDTDSSGGPFTPIEQMQDAYRAAECTHLVACHEFADQATCLATNNYNDYFYVDPQIIAYILAGKVRYDGAAVAACLAAVAARTCDPSALANRRSTQQCLLGVYSGTLAAGATCSQGVECISQQCNATCEQACCMGMCVGNVPPTRAVPLAVGAMCPLGDSSFNPCVPDAYCDLATGLCTALQLAGASCSANTECADGLTCITPTGSFGSICGVRPSRGMSCATIPTCGDEGTYCDPTTKLCTDVGLPGASCAHGEACSIATHCDVATQTCIPFPSDGAPCSDGRCTTYRSFCSTPEVICKAPVANGQPCVDGIDCLSGSCGAALTCVDYPTCTW